MDYFIYTKTIKGIVLFELMVPPNIKNLKENRTGTQDNENYKKQVN